MPALPSMAQYEEFEYQLTPSERLHPKAPAYMDITEIEDERRILIKTRQFVGFLPVTDQTYVIVRPKAEIEDLFHMIRVSERAVHRLPEGIGTNWKKTDYPDLLDFMIHEFALGLNRIERDGLWKWYEASEEILSCVRGKINVGQTIRDPWLHGFTHKLSCQVADPNLNFPPNRLLRATTIALLRTPGLSGFDRKILSKWERIFRKIPLRHTKQDTHEVAQLISSKRGIPPSRAFYRKLMSIALFVLENSSLSLNAEGPIELNAFVVNMDHVFEGYVRNIVADGLAPDGYSVKDGNQNERQLFMNSNEYRIKPDVFIEKRERVIGVLDAKYTQRRPAKDDIAQILSYMCAFGLTKGLVVCPKTLSNSVREIFHTPICQVIIYPFDLSQMRVSEASLLAEVTSTLQ